MKKYLAIVISAAIFMISVNLYAQPTFPPGSGGSSLDLVKGTYTNGKYCTYTAVGTVLNCNSDGGTPITLAEAYFDAGALVPDTTSGLLQYDSNPNIEDYLAFDGTTDEYALFKWFPPGDWDLGTIKAKFVWAAGGDMDNAQTVIFGLNCYAVSDGDTVDVAFDTGAVTVSDAYADGDETGPLQKTTAATAAITVQGTPAAGDMVYCRVHRDADTDTSILDAWLLGLKIQYGISGTGPTAW